MKQFQSFEILRSLFLALYILTASKVLGSANNLVIFAGPHKAASTAVESFFYEFASGHSRTNEQGEVLSSQERKKTFGLRYWLWPRIESGVVAPKLAEEEEPYKIFGHLVTDHNNEILRNEILEGIREAWEQEGISGIVLGSEMFDQVGPTVEDYDATKAVNSIVEYLDIHPNDVTIALNYRTPRLDQWASMWKHVVQERDEDFELEYETWMCDTQLTDTHIQALATQMNPLNAANMYVEAGYNVKLIDMEGVAAADRDVVHVVACDIMDAKCKNGGVLNHQGDDLNVNSVEVEFSGLTNAQQKEAEDLFRYRDCAYIDLRENVKFGVVYNHSVWEDCDRTKSEIYQKLRDEPKSMYNALASQIKCPNSQHPVEKSEQIQIKDLLSNEEKKSKSSKSSRGESNGNSAGSFFMELFLFVGILAGAMTYQYHRMVKAGSHVEYDSAVPAGTHELEGQFTNDVDTEYGETDIDGNEDDDGLPSGYKD